MMTTIIRNHHFWSSNSHITKHPQHHHHHRHEALPQPTTRPRKALQYYRPVARELKRLEPLARSPVYSEQQAAASGVVTIRQLGLGHVMAAPWRRGD